MTRFGERGGTGGGGPLELRPGRGPGWTRSFSTAGRLTGTLFDVTEAFVVLPPPDTLPALMPVPLTTLVPFAAPTPVECWPDATDEPAEYPLFAARDVP